MLASTLNADRMAADKLIAYKLAEQLGRALMEKSWTVTTAESCTGGLVAAALTDIAGSSAWFHQGVVTYANVAKAELLGVEDDLLIAHGAVSEPVVEAMALGAKRKARADIAVAISGVAGPGGGTTDKPVGTVWIGWAFGLAEVQSTHYLLTGDRMAVRDAALIEALRGTIQRV